MLGYEIGGEGNSGKVWRGSEGTILEVNADVGEAMWEGNGCRKLTVTLNLSTWRGQITFGSNGSSEKR